MAMRDMQALQQMPFLSDEEVSELCAPLRMPGAQCRYLRKLGLMVQTKPNGRALVARSEFERVLGAARFAPTQNDARQGPNVAALRNFMEGRRNGARTQGR